MKMEIGELASVYHSFFFHFLLNTSGMGTSDGCIENVQYTAYIHINTYVWARDQRFCEETIKGH